MNSRKAFTLWVMMSLVASFAMLPMTPVKADGTGTIVFDYSHGQRSSYVAALDLLLEGNLTDMGYTVVWATGGINSSILADADGLIIGSTYNVQNNFTTAEVNAIGSWYGEGKFLWVGYDSDYAGYYYITEQSNKILKKVGSHVYGEPTSVADSISNAQASYRVVATATPSYLPYKPILMHGPTCLYGSSSADPLANAVNLETGSIANVYPILWYNASAEIADADLRAPLAHTDGDSGAFVAATYERLNGGVVVVSGASPYGDYQPMCSDEYYDTPLDGMAYVTHVIDGGMNDNLIPADMTMILLLGGVGVVVIVIIVAIIFMRKK